MPLQITKFFNEKVWLTLPNGDVIEIWARKDSANKVKFIIDAPKEVGIHHKREYLIHALEELEHANGN
tara:strand:+ start:163 stop:366 length:204 start_codon:yes stop_codon:yes gene_type:complete